MNESITFQTCLVYAIGVENYTFEAQTTHLRLHYTNYANDFVSATRYRQVWFGPIFWYDPIFWHGRRVQKVCGPAYDTRASSHAIATLVLVQT